MTRGAGLLALIGSRTDADTLAVADDAETISRRELFTRATTLAAELAETVPSGARVGVRTTGDARSIVDVVAALLSGRSAALLPADHTPEQVAAANIGALVAGGEITRTPPNDDPRLDPAFGIRVGAGEEMVVLFTSGTTQLPRGVRLSETNLVSNLTAMLRLTEPWTPQDRVGQVLTLSHSFGLSMVLLALARRTPIIMLPNGAPSRQLSEAMDTQGVTVFACVPYFLRLMARRGLDLGGSTAPGLRQLYLAGGGIGDAELDAVIPHFAGRTYLMYGFTEATARVALRRRGDGAPANSVGLPLPGTHVRIVSDDGDVIPPGQPGWIQVLAPSLMIGYLGQECRPPAAPVTTTDTGYLDEAGNLFITGRAAEMMNFRGNRVSVLSVEAVVNRVDGVRECCLRPDSTDEDSQAELLIVADADADIKAVRRAALAAVSPAGLVRRITLLDELPRSSSGKLLRRTTNG